MADVDPIAAVLGLAFFDYPLFTNVLPDAAHRLRQVRWVMSCLARYAARHGRIDTTSQPISAAALWLPPGQSQPSMWRMARAGMIRAPWRLGLRGLWGLLRAADQWGRLQANQPPHWYLLALGVEPSLQGRGLGGRLLYEGLCRADESQAPCYLETMLPQNVTFYRKHGFEVLVEGRLGSGLPFWTMRRPTKAHHS